MRWEDCVNRYMEKVGGEWRTTAKDRRSWRLDREHSKIKLRREKTNTKTIVTMANLNPDDWDTMRRTSVVCRQLPLHFSP